MSSPLAAVGRFPRVRLGHAPTPLDPAPQLGAALGIELWIKRDDCTGLAFGGNKVRQLEFHLGEAQARGAEVSDTVHAPGYGRLNDAVREAMAMAARHEALLLDPVYTGKAMAGLVAHVRAGRITAGSRVLFLHTGGLPALFAYADKLGSWLTKAPWAPSR